jgi:hypothetical protein
VTPPEAARSVLERISRAVWHPERVGIGQGTTPATEIEAIDDGVFYYAGFRSIFAVAPQTRAKLTSSGKVTAQLGFPLSISSIRDRDTPIDFATCVVERLARERAFLSSFAASLINITGISATPTRHGGLMRPM